MDYVLEAAMRFCLEHLVHSGIEHLRNIVSIVQNSIQAKIDSPVDLLPVGESLITQRVNINDKIVDFKFQVGKGIVPVEQAVIDFFEVSSITDEAVLRENTFIVVKYIIGELKKRGVSIISTVSSRQVYSSDTDKIR